MNDLTMLRDHGPAAAELSTSARAAARDRLTEEIRAATSARPAWPLRWAGDVMGRRPVRLALGATVALVVLAATVTLLQSRPSAVPGQVSLVAVEAPVFPVSLQPVPTGLTAPTFSGQQVDSSLNLNAVYLAADGHSDIYLGVGDRYVPQAPESDIQQVSVAGGVGYLVDVHRAGEPAHTVLSWQHRPGQWLTLTGLGRFATEAAVRRLAATVVDDPQSVSLQVRLAPVGWGLYAFKDGTIVTLRDATGRHDLTVNLIHQPTADLAHQVAGARHVSQVQVDGHPGQLVQTVDGWFLQVALPGGSAYTVQAPSLLTRQQIVAVAEQVTVLRPAR